MSGIIHKIEEKLHIGGHKEGEKQHDHNMHKQEGHKNEHGHSEEYHHKKDKKEKKDNKHDNSSSDSD
uniref:Uncharacterized protein n=1 Tax=Solanum lycopersicum TaxID=4081 RepID=A0A3Q7FGV1_SOLLC